MYNYLTFGNISSFNYNVYITNAGIYQVPTRNYEVFSIPGKNGDIIIDNGNFNNIDITYPCYIPNDFERNFISFVADMQVNNNDYQKLEDTFSPNYYREGILKEVTKAETPPNAKIGKFNLVFNCKPQKFLKSGEKVITATTNFALFNPTKFTAKPYFTVYSEIDTGGWIRIDNIEISFTYIDEFITVDCESMNAFKRGVVRNQDIELIHGKFPELQGNTKSIIELSDSLSKIEFIPRWWTI